MIALSSRRHFAIEPGFSGEVERVMNLATASRDREPGQMAVWLDEATPADLYTVVDGVALIAIRGVLLDRWPWHGDELATGYNGIRIACAMALADPAVKAIVLDIDSGGGMVAGCFELCEWLRAARAIKPLVGIVTNWAASAAYAIASTCQSLAGPRTGGVGSIGVVMMHLDVSKWLETAGLRVTLIHAGKHKVDGNMLKPLPEAVREDWLATCEAYRTMFAEAVSAGRPKLTIEAALATEARFYDGPVHMTEAARLGLIDALMSPDDALGAVIAHHA